MDNNFVRNENVLTRNNHYRIPTRLSKDSLRYFILYCHVKYASESLVFAVGNICRHNYSERSFKPSTPSENPSPIVNTNSPISANNSTFSPGEIYFSTLISPAAYFPCPLVPGPTCGIIISQNVNASFFFCPAKTRRNDDHNNVGSISRIKFRSFTGNFS